MKPMLLRHIFQLRSKYLRLNSLRYFQILFTIVAYLQINTFGSQFGTNDDTTIAQVASGGWTGKPSQYLIFINVVIGWVLRGLYAFAPPVQWYAVLIVVSIGFASTTFCNIILQHISRNIFRSSFTKHLLTVCLLSPIIYYTYANIQTLNYSSTAFFCSVCGILGLLLSLNNNSDKRIIQPMLTAIIGYLWRDTAFLSVVILTAPVVLLSVTSHNWRKYLQYSISLSFVIFIIFQFDRFSYRANKSWREYLNYDEARGALHGNKPFSQLLQSQSGYEQLLDKSGFSPSQLDLLAGWYINMKTMPLRGIEAMVALTNNRFSILDSRIHQPLFGEFLQIVLLILISSIIFIYFFKVRGVRLLVALVMTIALLGTMFAFLDTSMRLPAYVRQGLTLGSIASTLTMLLLTLQKNRLVPRLVRFDPIVNTLISLILLTMTIGLYKSNFAASNNTMQSTQRDFSESTNHFLSSVSTPTLGSSFPIPLGQENPFGSFRLTSLKLIPVGWMVHSPHSAARMRYFHLSEDIDQAILDGKLTITFGDETETPGTFQDYLCVTYSIPTIATTIKNTNSLFTAAVLRKGGTCESSLIMDGSNPQEPMGLWSVEPEKKIRITNCRSGEINTVGFNVHAPFGAFAKQMTMRISTDSIEEESSRVIKVKPFQDNFVEIETTSCSVKLSSLSAGVIPMLVDPESQDQRTLFFGLSDLRLISS